jgi:cytochrome c biogenesis protein
MTQMVVALSDAQIYPAPVVLALKDFTQVQASVFEVARAPGKNIVYLGCALLIIGVFAMLYIRDRRLWVWLQQDAGGGTPGADGFVVYQPQTLDGDREFAA